MGPDELEDAASVAEEFGGRLGFLAPTGATEQVEAVIVRSMKGEEAATLVVTQGDGVEWRLMMRHDDLTWVLANPITVDGETT